MKLQIFLTALLVSIAAAVLTVVVVRSPAPVAPTNLGMANQQIIPSTNTGSISCVTATSTQVLAAASGRVYGLITLTSSSSDVWLKLGSAAAANQGMLLTGLGASYEITPLNLYTGQVTCIAASATSTLVVTYN